MKILFLSLFFIPTLNLFSQVITDSFLIENHFRSFHFTQQEKKKNANLIFVLHGSGGNGLNMQKEASKLEALSKKENLIIVYPNGYKKFWNECRKASTAEANKININEQFFFTKMIQYFYTNYGISKKKVFVIGFSGGGHMAFKLAQTIPQKFGGICTIVANLPDTSNNDCVLVKKQIPVLMVNGTADIVSPYLGGNMNTTGVSLGTVQSVENTFKYWAKVNGVFSDTPILGLTQLRDTLNNTTAITKYYSKPLKPKTTLISITNGKHELPKIFDVFEVAWEFFKSEMERKKY